MKKLMIAAVPMFVLVLITATAFGEDRVISALRDKALAEQATRLRTDDRIAFYVALVKAQPETLQYQVLLAGTYIQKMRETTDFSYIDRAEKLLQAVLDADSSQYDALRLRTETELERHNFKKVAQDSMHLAEIAPADSWNWGTLGDAYIELGDYDKAADAYQRMMNLRPDLASYNRAAHYRFLNNDMKGAIEIMKLAITAGSTAPENIAWCWVELGAYYLKSGQLDLAGKAYTSATQTFPNYHPAFAGMGKVYAAKGDIGRAIDSYTRAQSITPLPDYAAALYDLYLAAKQPAEAGKQKQLIETIDTLAKANGEKVNRNLAIIYADHDWHLDRALELATAELEYRKDVYTYDALGWVLYKNKRYGEAAKAMELALKLKTPEPGFQAHARLINESFAVSENKVK